MGSTKTNHKKTQTLDEEFESETILMYDSLDYGIGKKRWERLVIVNSALSRIWIVVAKLF